MSYTKRQIIMQAVAEIGLSTYEFDLTAEEFQTAMRQLDNMMAVWIRKGIVFDPVYPIPVPITSGSLDDDTNAPDFAIQAMMLNLAVRLAPGLGKMPAPDTKKDAVKAYNSLLLEYISTEVVSLDGGIRGAGGKQPFRPFLGEPDASTNP